MKKVFAVLLAALMILSLVACGKTGQNGKDTQNADVPVSESDQPADNSDASPVGAQTVDVGSLNWVKGELDCYGYSEKGVDCYMSFSYPDNFKTGEENSSGMQYRGYYYNPADPETNADASPYGLYIYFNQGAFGAKRETMEADIEGGFTERELGGRTVLFGEVGKDENTGAYAFSYYTSYSDDEYARIWFMVCDPEEDGAFRRAFEESISFVKE
ncbi:MAG: hypothetical protein IJK23_13020 [Clostridia bacterium]|nr:hypothetical protein [Clostridia bacterium]